MRRQDKLKNIMEANITLLKEDHEHSDDGKKEYIISALDNLSSEDLQKIYLSVVEYDPEYDGHTKYKQEYVPHELGGYHKDIKHYSNGSGMGVGGPR